MEVTREQLRREVRGLVGDDEGAAIPRFESDMMNEWLTAELESLAASSGWVNSQRTEVLQIRAGQSEYGLPFGTNQVDLLVDPASQQQWGRGVDEIEFFQSTLGDGASPIWTLRGNPIHMRIKPTPAADFELDAYLEIHPVLPPSDRSAIHLRPELKDAVVYAVAARCHERERDFDMADRRRNVMGAKMELLRSNSGDNSNSIHVLRIVT